MRSTTFYIIDPTQKFNGSVISSMTAPEGQTPIYVDYSSMYNEDKGNLTFEEFKKSKDNENLIVISGLELENKYFKPYYEGLKTSFKKTTEKKFYYGFECLPPQRFTRITKGFFFFISEAYTADLHTCYAKVGKKYYSSLRSIREDSESIVKAIQEVAVS